VSLIENLRQVAEERRPPSVKCFVCALLDNLPTEDAKALNEALNNPNITKASIAKILQAEGHHITYSSLGRHARGDCVTKR
jgi:hypothetical protein